jgi:membrane-associated protease RseP (regulator of RpoE activity)
MEIRNRWRKQIEGGGHIMSHKFISRLALAVALLVASGGVLHAQKVPAPLPAPPEAPEPPDSSQYLFLNDGTAHLGVTLGDVTTEKAQELKLPAVAGAIVNHVQKNSAAAKAGIEAGDAIMEFDGVRVRSSAELRRLIRETPAGRTVEMKVVRGGKTRVLSAKLEAYTNNFNLNMPEIRLPSINVMPEIRIPPSNLFEGHPFFFGASGATLGISGDDLTPQLAQYFGVKQGKGVLISEVTVGGSADKAGLKAGDVIVQVDGQPISGVEELRSALNDNFTGDTRKVSLTIVRDHHEQTVNADLTRSQTWEKRTASAAGQNLALALAQIQRAQADQQRAQANQLRVLADHQRALVQAEVLKQQQHEQAEWQRQLREQMRSLQDQLRQMQNLHVALHQDGEV